MNTNINPEKPDFIKKLEQVGEDEKALIRLAKEAINESHDKRTFLERKNRDIRFNPCGIAIGNAIATGHAMANSVFTTKDKLYMVMKKYIDLTIQKKPKISKDEALNKFCRDFAAEFPKEYGIQRTFENIDNQQMEIVKQSRVITQ